MPPNSASEALKVYKQSWLIWVGEQVIPWVEKQIVHRPKAVPWQVVVRDSLLILELHLSMDSLMITFMEPSLV
ncbi:hypothetical protein H0E87_007380 [Populus deltoides]|uniref:Uncharacterized protein n=1 Tax=Populus deltoides TaxID=3696 RepID=A0A8T2ZAZ9_POPDE|nr:hypothetical protein H0E87_007380 [Populus deltoides]